MQTQRRWLTGYLIEPFKGFLLSRRSLTCIHCQAPTMYVSVCYEAHLHPACERPFDEWVAEDLRTRPVVDDSPAPQQGPDGPEDGGDLGSR